MTPCSLTVYLHFRRTYWLHHHALLTSGCLDFDLFFGRDVAGRTLLRNIGQTLSDYMPSHSRRPCASFFLFCHGVRLSPLGTASTVWPIVPALDDRWWWMWSNRWNTNWQGKPKYSEKTCPSATLSTTNPTWTDPGSNPARSGRKPATNSLSYGTTSVWFIITFIRTSIQ
jgi:hypothetical protein